MSKTPKIADIDRAIERVVEDEATAQALKRAMRDLTEAPEDDEPEEGEDLWEDVPV